MQLLSRMVSRTTLILMIGNGNQYRTTQTGSNNTSDAYQEGNNNMGGGSLLTWGTLQDGNNNYSDVYSYGDGKQRRCCTIRRQQRGEN